MIEWINAVAAVCVVGVASVWMFRRLRPHRERHRPDSHWGDWPPDQMST